MDEWAWPNLAASDAHSDTIPRLVGNLRRRAPRLGCRVSLEALCHLGRIEVISLPLSARRGHVESIIIRSPDPTFRFRVAIDPGATRRVNDVLFAEGPRTRAAFRLGHEIAHSFFFDWREQGGDDPSFDEESFCDEFAEQLLLPYSIRGRLPKTAKDLVAVARHHTVPIKILAKRVVASTGDLTVELRDRKAAAPAWRFTGVGRDAPDRSEDTARLHRQHWLVVGRAGQSSRPLTFFPQDLDTRSGPKPSGAHL